MKVNKFYNKLSLIGLVLALTLLPGCNKTTTAVDKPASTPITNTTTNSAQNNTSAQQQTTYGESEIHFIDTGNADAILIVNNGEAMLIDGAENDDEEFLVKYLKDRGITELEYLIATHAHADHVGGLDAIVENLHINTLFVANGDADTKVYTDFINAAMNKGLTPSVPLEDSEFPLGNAYFKVMNTNGGSDTNNESLVVEYINGEDRALFMADAEEEVEEEILSRLDQVDLLKVGHHGSRTSTSQSFIEKVRPTYAVITCGEGNKYGHPHQETLDKLEGVEVHRTDKCGSVVFKSTGHGMSTDCSDSTSNASEGHNVIVEPSTNKVDTSNTNATTNSNVTNQTAASNTAQSTATVYWTPNGKSYHAAEDCSTLSRSKTILSGTISESGKADPCDKCYN